MLAITFTRPPQCSHFSMSILKTRFKRRAQFIRTAGGALPGVGNSVSPACREKPFAWATLPVLLRATRCEGLQCKGLLALPGTECDPVVLVEHGKRGKACQRAGRAVHIHQSVIGGGGGDICKPYDTDRSLCNRQRSQGRH